MVPFRQKKPFKYFYTSDIIPNKFNQLYTAYLVWPYAMLQIPSHVIRKYAAVTPIRHQRRIYPRIINYAGTRWVHVDISGAVCPLWLIPYEVYVSHHAVGIQNLTHVPLNLIPVAIALSMIGIANKIKNNVIVAAEKFISKFLYIITSSAELTWGEFVQGEKRL